MREAIISTAIAREKLRDYSLVLSLITFMRLSRLWHR